LDAQRTFRNPEYDTLPLLKVFPAALSQPLQIPDFVSAGSAIKVFKLSK
jgi:hypothetical protein